MEWTTALEALGGGASALLTLGAVYLYWRADQRAEKYAGILMSRRDDELKAAVQREEAVRSTLGEVLKAIERMEARK